MMVIITALLGVSVWLSTAWSCYGAKVTNHRRDSIDLIRATLHEMSTTGRMNDIIGYLETVEKDYGTLLIDNVVPSLYSYKGVALYNGLRVAEALSMMEKAVYHYPNDTRSWINLGEMQVQTFQLDLAFKSFYSAFLAGDISGLPRAVRTKGWSASWQNFEALTSVLEREANTCVNAFAQCRIDTAGGMEYGDIDGRAHVLLNGLNPNSMQAAVQVPAHTVAPYWTSELNKLAQVDTKPTNKPVFSLFGKPAAAPTQAVEVMPREAPAVNAQFRRLKVGFMSSDFGVHPVAQLVRGLFQLINTSRVEVYCFALQPKLSWWGQNISSTVEHFVWLQNMNTLDAAKEVARLGVEVLIDLNGHTMHSGLTIMTHRPAPVQMSFLGLPTTTAAPFIDYYIADSVAVPPEQRLHYSEQLVLMSDCYIANDYAQIQGDVLKFTEEHRAPRSLLPTKVDLSDATFLFATLSNSQKMHPEIFHVWMNILRRFPGSKMVITEHAGSGTYMPHLHKDGESYGVAEGRLVSIAQTPWIDHLYVKTAFDLILDTTVKNGHTTGLDGIWAGIPTISLAGGGDASARAAESIAVSLDSMLGMAYSLKEYEDMAFALARKRRKDRNLYPNAPLADHKSGGEHHKRDATDSKKSGEERLRLWRKHVASQRTTSALFDMPQYETQFTRLLQGTWELAHLARLKSAFDAHPTSGRNGVKGLSIKHSSVSEGLNKKKYNTKGLFHIFTPTAYRHHCDYTGDSDTNGDYHNSLSHSHVGTKRPSNRDEQNRIFVSQTHSEGSLISEAVRVLEGGSASARSPAVGSAAASTTAQDTSIEQASSESLQSTSGASRRQVGPKSAREKESVSQRYPPIPSYVFDGRLIMLNIGNLLRFVPSSASKCCHNCFGFCIN